MADRSWSVQSVNTSLAPSCLPLSTVIHYIVVDVVSCPVSRVVQWGFSVTLQHLVVRDELH